jgi:epsin
MVVRKEYGGYSSGGGSGGFRDDGGRRGFQEYNAGDDELPGSSRRSGSISRRPGTSGGRVTSPPRSSTAPNPATATKAKEPVKVVNLLDGFDDDEGFGSTSGGKPLPTDKALPSLAAADGTFPSLTRQRTKPHHPPTADDDFADFVAAPQSPAPAPKTTTTATKPNLMDILNATSTSTSSTGASRPAIPTHTPAASISRPYAASNTSTSFGGMMAPSAPQTQTQNYGFQPMSPATRTTTTTSTSTSTTSASKPATGFDDLWTMSLASSSTTANKTGAAGKSIKDLEKEKTLAGIWGPSGMGSAQKPQTPAAGGNAAFVPAGTAMGASGVDDLLL